jgi:cysteine synthase
MHPPASHPSIPDPSVLEMHRSPIKADLAGAVGNTPLIRLRRASEETGCEVLGKAEFMNPGGSVKDRAALWIIRDAVARGELEPGGTIVEGTAGNTGIGLALVGASMGFRTVIVIPETQSQEKKDMLRLAGAELIQVPAAPYRDSNNYVRYSGRLAEELRRTEPRGVIWANQFDNVANRQAHVEGTGPEVWEQTGGRVDGFVCAVGTGGTVAGVAEALQGRGVRVGLADPEGARSTRSTRRGPSRRRGRASRKASARAASPPTSRASAPTTPGACPTPRRCPSSSTSCPRRGCASGDRRGSTSPARCAWPARWGRGTRS